MSKPIVAIVTVAYNTRNKEIATLQQRVDERDIYVFVQKAAEAERLKIKEDESDPQKED
ncbi:MAG TPA: hypothetical protein VFI02_14155 [Armatimonadota bacterium]|nr:hypothetical protein [Armatimonadota bacterium]